MNRKKTKTAAFSDDLDAGKRLAQRRAEVRVLVDRLSSVVAAERRQPLDVHLRREVLLTEVRKKRDVPEPPDYLFRQPVLAAFRLSLRVRGRRVLRLDPLDLGFEVADLRRQTADELPLGFVHRGKFGDLFFENLDVLIVLDRYESAKKVRHTQHVLHTFHLVTGREF